MFLPPPPLKPPPSFSFRIPIPVTMKLFSRSGGMLVPTDAGTWLVHRRAVIGPTGKPSPTSWYRRHARHARHARHPIAGRAVDVLAPG